MDQDTAHQFEIERLRRSIESTTDTTALKEMCRKLLQLAEGQRAMLGQLLLQGIPRLGGWPFQAATSSAFSTRTTSPLNASAKPLAAASASPSTWGWIS